MRLTDLAMDALAEAKAQVTLLEGEKAGIADVLNQELRENNGDAFQVTMDRDFRPSIRKLVDCAKKCEAYQYKSRIESLTRQLEEMRKEILDRYENDEFPLCRYCGAEIITHGDIVTLTMTDICEHKEGCIVSRLTQKGEWK